MKAFDFSRPARLEDVFALLAEQGETIGIIAGGTDLLVGMRRELQGTEHIRLVLDITGIPGMDQIIQENDQVHIGPLVTHEQAAGSALLQKTAPFLAEACLSVGSPQIRNAGTLGGSVCNASPAADPIPPLLALDAQVVLSSSKEERTLPLGEFIIGSYKTVRHSDELLTDIFFKIPAGAQTAFIKVGRRKALAVARINVAVLVKVENGQVRHIRIVPGAVMPKAENMTAAGEFLLGKIPIEADIEAAAQKVAEDMVRITGRRWSTAYKEPVVQVLIRRALCKTLGVNQK
jgi:carbon-monoxide dehydrogenase medium subunit/xanthine dehydrogenase FAD-binding subunit